jgi:hypothetical protein
MKKIIKILAFIVLALLLIVSIGLAILPNYAAKYLSENGKELTSRNLQIGDIDLNYFSGKLGIEQFLMFEENEIDTFLYVKGLYVNIDLLDCINERYHVESIIINQLKTSIVMDGEVFNFDGLINHFASEDTVQVEQNLDSSSVFYVIDELLLSNSSIYFEDKVIGSKIQLQDIEINSPEKITSENPVIEALVSLSFKSGGVLKTDIIYNQKEETYDFELISEALELNVFQPYLEDFMYLGLFQGYLDSDLKIHGNLNDKTDIDVTGPIRLADLKVTDTNDIKVSSIALFEIKIDSINPAKDVYEVSKIELDSAFVRFELGKETDNISSMMIETDSIIDSTHTLEEEYYSNVFVMLGAYIHDALEGIKASNFNIDTLQLHGLQFHYIDHTLIQKFDYQLSSTNLDAYGLNSHADSLNATVSSLLNNQGILDGNATFYPQNPKDIRIDLSLDKLAMKDLSPYFHYYVAFPILKGLYRMKSSLSIKNYHLISHNDLVLEYFTLGKKQKHDSAMNVPLRLAVSMLKDRRGNIPINVPVEGDLSDPKYKVWKTVGRIFSELILKAASAPYKLIAGAVQTDEESARNILFKNPIDTIFANQYKRLDKIVEVIQEKPELTLLLHANYQLQVQAEKLAMIHAKSDYLELNRIDGFSSSELNKINELDVMDSTFQVYIKSKLSPEIQNMRAEKKVFFLYDSLLLQSEVKRKIKNQVQGIFEYLKSKGVKESNLPQIINKEEVLYENSSMKSIQVQILFDVL